MRCSFRRALEEMHIIAYVYHWERDTLWKMPSRERRMWVSMINTQKKMENSSVKANAPKINKRK